MTPILRIEGLSVDAYEGHLWRRKKTRILHDISFEIPQGSLVAYLGPNGAGKTTTFRAICGLSTQYRARLFWKGEAISIDGLHRHIGFLPEQPYFYRSLTPRELLGGLGQLSGMQPKQVRSRTAELADRLDFAKVLDRPIRTCSKGQLQRVGLAQAMIHNPELLILDEPMSGLDPLGRRRVRDVLLDTGKAGTTIIFSSHILADAESLCHRVVALDHGKIIYTGELNKLVQQGGAWELLLQGTIPSALHGFASEALPDNTVRICSNEQAMPLQKAISICLETSNCRLLSANPMRETLEKAFLSLLEHADAI